ncbi:MAG: sialidase family protein [Eubacteriales bacterium]|nr:sialidase family protein [Eubacteriales bacterium]
MKTGKIAIVEEFGKRGYEEYRIPSIIITKKGTVLTAYEARRESKNDWSRVDVAVRRSCDQGYSFEAPIFPQIKIEEAVSGEQTWSNPLLIADGDHIHLLFCQNYERVWFCTSMDEGVSFGTPRELTDVFKGFPYVWNVCAVGPGHGIVSRKGRLIVPIWLANGEVRMDIDLSGRIKNHFPSVAGCIYSDDRGKTWNTGFVTQGIENANETTAAELKNGKILFNFRNERYERRRVLGIADETLTRLEKVWTEDTLPDPTCFGSMAQGENGLYFVNCANADQQRIYSERIHLTLYKSGDQAATWKAIKEIDYYGGYADVCLYGGYAYIFYEHCKEGKVEQLIVSRFEVEEEKE